jgi:hypothetical protein
MASLSNNYMVFLDGKLIKNCLEYDRQRGYVKYYELEQNGNIIMEDLKAQIIIAKGKVEIKSIVELIAEGKY